MSTSWAIYALLVGALLMVAANAMAAAGRRIGLSTRIVWGVAMAALVGLCLSAPLRMAPGAPLMLNGVNVVQGHAIAPVSSSITLSQRVNVARAALARMERGMTSTVARSLPRVSPGMLTLAWMTASALVIALMLAVSTMMARRVTKWPRTELHGAPVRLTHDIGPAVVGFTAPEIVIPGWLLARSDDEQRLALEHERQHVAARDHWLLAGGWLVVALMPWHPAAWWMLGRLRLAIELDCDARVLRAGVTTRSYGQMLIDIADHCSGQRALTLALADRTSHLERRLLAMKKPRARFGRTRATMLAATGALAVLVACESKMPTSAEIENSNVAVLEQKASEATIMSRTGLANAVYVVDGKQVSDSVAHSIKASELASVGINKGATGNRIFITTKDGLDSKSSIAAKGLPLNRVGEFKVKMDSAVDSKTHDMVQIRSKAKFEGLYVIDGQVVSQDAFQHLNPQDIESVEVFKGAAAERLYSNPAAVNGVISIKTRK